MNSWPHCSRASRRHARTRRGNQRINNAWLPTFTAGHVGHGSIPGPAVRFAKRCNGTLLSQGFSYDSQASLPIATCKQASCDPKACRRFATTIGEAVRRRRPGAGCRLHRLDFPGDLNAIEPHISHGHFGRRGRLWPGLRNASTRRNYLLRRRRVPGQNFCFPRTHARL